MSLIADSLDEYDQIAAYKDLRVVRRKNRLAHLDWFDAFYKAYVTAILCAVGLYVAVNQMGQVPLNAHHVQQVQDKGPAFIGLVLALAFAVGFRSGGRGGPLAFEHAEVRHVLLAPLDKRVSVRQPALRQLRHVLFLSVTAGGAIGFVVSGRFTTNVFEWIGCGALMFGAAICGAYGAAMLTGGLRWPRWLADVLALAVVLWSAADILLKITTSPLTWLGHVGVWPLAFEPIGIAGIVVALVVAALGTFYVNRLSIEAAERRSKLVGQLRFAATLQDVRTVMVLQRQLAQEHIRVKPWIRMRPSKKAGTRNGRVSGVVFARRSLAGMLRWPAARMARVVVMVALAAACMVGVWGGSIPLVVVAGIALWIGALDLLEALAQEVDHPDRLSSVAQKRGVIYLRHLLIPFVVMYALVLGAMTVIYAFTDSREVMINLFPVGMVAALAAIGGAATAITQKPALPSGAMETPEIASAKFAIRVVLPPGIAIIGLLPVVFAQRAWSIHHTTIAMGQGMNTILIVAMVFAGWSVAWIRYRDELLDTTKSTVSAAVADPPKEKQEKSAQNKRTQAVGTVKSPPTKNKKKGKK